MVEETLTEYVAELGHCMHAIEMIMLVGLLIYIPRNLVEMYYCYKKNKTIDA